MNTRRTLFISVISLTTILACVIPGLPTTSAPALAPTVDTGILSTMVAETVSAAIVLTEQAFPTPTLVPTSTPTSEPTLTPTASLLFSSYGTYVEEQVGVGTLYIDQIAGYQFIVPIEWTFVRPNEQEYFELLALPIAENPTIQKTLDSMKNLDPNLVRAYGFDFRDTHIKDEFIINFDVALSKDLNGSYEDIFSQIEKSYSNPELINKFKVLSSGVTTTPAGIEVGMIEFEIDGILSAPDLKLYEKQVILKIQSGGYLVIRFDTTYEFKDLTLAEFEQLIASLKPYTP